MRRTLEAISDTVYALYTSDVFLYHDVFFKKNNKKKNKEKIRKTRIHLMSTKINDLKLKRRKIYKF